jgi:hypothetical protein
LYEARKIGLAEIAQWQSLDYARDKSNCFAILAVIEYNEITASKSSESANLAEKEDKRENKPT